MSGYLFLGSLALLGGVVAFFRYRARRLLVRSRAPKDIEDIHRELGGGVGLPALRDAMDAVGAAYGVDPRLVRPGDLLVKYDEYDSWVLGEGRERLSEWLVARGVTIAPGAISTVLDLAISVGGASAQRVVNHED